MSEPCTSAAIFSSHTASLSWLVHVIFSDDLACLQKFYVTAESADDAEEQIWLREPRRRAIYIHARSINV